MQRIVLIIIILSLFVYISYVANKLFQKPAANTTDELEAKIAETQKQIDEIEQQKKQLQKRLGAESNKLKKLNTDF